MFLALGIVRNTLCKFIYSLLFRCVPFPTSSKYFVVDLGTKMNFLNFFRQFVSNLFPSLNDQIGLRKRKASRSRFI